MNILKETESARKDWIDAKQENSILGYVNFVAAHPYCEYREEAEALIQSMKGNLLSDMKRYPFKYNRELMYDYISTNALTKEDLVDSSNTLTDRAYSHIKKHPDIILEYFKDPLPHTDKDHNFLFSEHRKNSDIDILPFGVCGSGGKTSLLASIMAQLDERNDFISIEFNEYAECLSDSINRNCLLPGTAQFYIYEIPTKLMLDKKESFNITFWEFAGEQVPKIARSNDFTSGSDIDRVLCSPNKKILLFAIDPTNQHKIQYYDRNSEQEFWLYQPQILELISSLLLKIRNFSNNIIGVYIIITKADTWNKRNKDYEDFLNELGFQNFVEDLKVLCKRNKIMPGNNYNPRIVPFTIGKFMPGDTYTYDERSTLSLLKLIKNDLKLYKEQQSIINKIKSFLS